MLSLPKHDHKKFNDPIFLLVNTELKYHILQWTEHFTHFVQYHFSTCQMRFSFCYVSSNSVRIIFLCGLNFVVYEHHFSATGLKRDNLKYLLSVFF